VLAVVGSASPASAQSVEVSPLRVDLVMTRGAAHTQAVTLTNQGPEPVRIRARLQDWFMAKDGTPQFDAPVPEAEREFVTTAWVRLAPPEQVIEPGRQGIVRFTTTAPADAADGGYRAAILFEFAPATGELAVQGRSVQFRSRVATLIYIAVGRLQPSIELTDLAGRVRDGQAPSVVATLKNTGRMNVRTKGTASLRDAGGAVIMTVDIPNVPLLPMAERDLAIGLAKDGHPSPAAGEYAIEVKIDVGMPALIVGETVLKIPR
jgi:P pilus assembly chaperone PapD